MVKKKIDQRIRTLIENGVQCRHRSLFVMVGDQGQNQVANLHYILSKAQVAKRPSVLWCYKKELGFSSHKKKRMRQMKKKKSIGLLDAARLEEDPFELFLSSTDIRYTYYHETDRILGNTYGMCVLQDFEALTPNLLARTIETVAGGGVIVLLLQTLTSLKQLYTLAMDVHARYRTEGGKYEAVARFNERFLLSLTNCDNCLVVDDQLNVLPVSGLAREIAPIQRETIEGIRTPEQVELERLKLSLAESPDQKTAASLTGLTRTLDQAKVLQGIMAILGEQNGQQAMRTTAALTAARGRGKSAALGLSLAAAVATGFGNIFVTAPSPENLRTLFEFLFKGLEALGYTEHLDYDIVQSTHAEFNQAVVRVNIFRGAHRQTILYIHPQDSQLLSQAELIVIDEAAAIPLPLVQSLSSGPQLVLMASTINGYEGTGRSLSLKLIQQLRGHQSGGGAERKNGSATSSRLLREFTLNEPIRYGANDPIEKWLHGLLCLDVASLSLGISKKGSTDASGAGGFPAPEACDLYAVNRDTLFSYHKASETFLQRMMALYVASHYKNTPNDLQLMSDAPAHRLYVLLAPVDGRNNTSLPEILAVVQVALEGALTRETVMSGLARGRRAGGDLIPWTMAQQFQDDEFASLSGARIVRIAVHPELQGMGYGSRAIQQLELYYGGKLFLGGINDDPNALDEGDEPPVRTLADTDEENLRPRSNLKPLLVKLSDRQPIRLDWMGVSFGLTAPLFGFWRRLGYCPVYLRQTTNDITGEHTAIVLKRLSDENEDETVNEIENSKDRKGKSVGQALPLVVSGENWLGAFYQDFCRRFASLLGYQFRSLPASLCLDILLMLPSGTGRITSPSPAPPEALTQYMQAISVFDLKRLESYANNMVDYHMIVDLLPSMARHYFLSLARASEDGTGNGSLSLSPVQAAILLALGLQHRTVEEIEREINLPVSQLLAMLIKCVRKFARLYRDLHLQRIEKAEQGKGEGLSEESRPVLITPQDTPLSSLAHHPATNSKRSIERVAEWEPTAQDLEEDLDEAAREARERLREKKRELINALDLQQYIIGGDDEEWEAEIRKKGKNLRGATLNIKGTGATPTAATGSKGSLSKKLYDSKDAELLKKAKTSKYARK